MFNLQPRIERIAEKGLVGKSVRMSLADNKTGELWRTFMPRRREILNNLTNDLFSLQVYDPDYFVNFSPDREFVKYALVEVTNFESVPAEMETFALIGGEYAVFDYKGLNTDSRIFQYIFGEWLPNSEFLLDSRPHFEILGEKYKNGDPNSEEEIWIPIKVKS